MTSLHPPVEGPLRGRVGAHQTLRRFPSPLWEGVGVGRSRNAAEAIFQSVSRESGLRVTEA